MQTSLVKSIWRFGSACGARAACSPLSAACTDLTEVPNDALTPANAFRTEEEILAGVASVYAALRGPMWGGYNLSEITTDEIVVPTRGSDWYDNGRWLEIYRQTWTANSGSALDDMNGTWNAMFSGVARANLMISVDRAVPAEPRRRQRSPSCARCARGTTTCCMDLFGGVPLVTDDRGRRSTRACHATRSSSSSRPSSTPRARRCPSGGRGAVRPRDARRRRRDPREPLPERRCLQQGTASTRLATTRATAGHRRRTGARLRSPPPTA